MKIFIPLVVALLAVLVIVEIKAKMVEIRDVIDTDTFSKRFVREVLPISAGEHFALLRLKRTAEPGFRKKFKKFRKKKRSVPVDEEVQIGEEKWKMKIFIALLALLGILLVQGIEVTTLQIGNGVLLDNNDAVIHTKRSVREASEILTPEDSELIRLTRDAEAVADPGFRKKLRKWKKKLVKAAKPVVKTWAVNKAVAAAAGAAAGAG